MSQENLNKTEVNDEEEEVPIKARFVIPQRLDFITFVGRDILAIAHDIYITFFNLKTQTEIVYIANNKEDGDGIDCITGYRTNVFAFAEKPSNARIFVVTYPAFMVIAELKDPDVNRYKALCMMEGDLIMAFSGFPNYIATVWSWRKAVKLYTFSTGVLKRKQVYMASRSHMLVCQCWGEKLCVWEISPCYQINLVMQRHLVSDAVTLHDICWTVDGQLYAIDAAANLYSVGSDGIGMVTSMEWSGESKGDELPHICSFGNGLIIYCPDGMFRSLKKCDHNWKVVWTWTAPDTVNRLLSNAFSDMAVVWTESGYIYTFTGETEEKINAKLFTYKQRNILKAQILAPDNDHIVTINKIGLLCLYNIISGTLVDLVYVMGDDVNMEASPVEPVIVVFGEISTSYGMMLLKYTGEGFQKVWQMPLTHQIVSRVVFSPTGRHIMAAAMSAGHIFIYKLSEQHDLTLCRYAELGRGLADCTMGMVGDDMRAFSLIIFSDKFAIGERIVCVNAETGKDNKFAGKMQGPYSQLIPLSLPGTMVAVPHHSMQYHLLKLSADKGVTISVKIAAIVETGHDLRQYYGFFSAGGFLTYGYDGTMIFRKPDGPTEYDRKLITSHRYEQGIRQGLIDSNNSTVVSLANNGTLAVYILDVGDERIQEDLKHPHLSKKMFSQDKHIKIMHEQDKTYLELQEDKKVKEEAMDYKVQRDEVVKNFEVIQARLVDLLEENLLEIPLHQLPLSEFNLHMEAKKERIKQAEKEREEIRLKTEALIRAQDHVTRWIRDHCWNVMLTQRVKLFAIFSHYQVENYPVLPTQRDNWPELQQIEVLRAVEMEKNSTIFKPWEEYTLPSIPAVPTEKSLGVLTQSSLTVKSKASLSEAQILQNASSEEMSDMHVLSGTYAHKYIDVPACMIPQTIAFSYLHMNWLQHIVKLNAQNMRLWFNKQFDELMAQKKREVGLVEDRNNRLRFIISELNKLSDLRSSFHHLIIEIKDPQWMQEEMPQTLIKVDPEECSIPPYISPSQIMIPPIDPGPKDDFRERALIEMMDGVLEKLWHEEIKKPVPKPQCMLDKDPEHFSEDDLRLVFEYEAKVEFRNQERDKYRKMLHAEYAKLTALLNEGIVKFNMKVKEMWVMKLKVESVIGQENLNLMRLRRTNLDRLEDAEKLEHMRNQSARYDSEVESLSGELRLIHEQSEGCQAAYEALALKDKNMERGFKNNFADLSPIIVDQCYKFFRKRPKWQQRALTPAVLHELANAIATGIRPLLLHADCIEYFKGVEALDAISCMPAVLDEALWTTMCKLRRVKIENEIRMRALVQEMATVDASNAIWNKAILARRTALHKLHSDVLTHRDRVEAKTRNKTIQLVLPAGQVEILSTGHVEDFEDATLILRTDIEEINNLILKVGQLKLKMMKKQMDFRRGILSKEWEHAQMKMKLRHMEQELRSYYRLKIPKELQLYLKNKELGYTEDREYLRMEKENEATKMSLTRILNDVMQRYEDLEMRTNNVAQEASKLEQHIMTLNVLVSEKRLQEDPLLPIRIRKIFKKRMETLVQRGQLIRQVQAQHSRLVMLQTELELLRLKTYPTLASFRTYC